jgi:large conductance mechanosensitive channel
MNFTRQKITNAVIRKLITAVIKLPYINKLGDTLNHKEEAPAAPTTKKCPFCKSEIAIDATRCPHCTSQLDK